MPYRASLPPSLGPSSSHSLLAPRRPTVAAGLRAARAGIDTEGGSPKIEEREERGKEGVPRGRKEKGRKRESLEERQREV